MRGALSHATYRSLFVAATFSNIGTFIQDTGEAWLMVSLGGTPLQIALVSATAWFPSVIFTLPAGALADQIDRRVILVVAQSFLAIVSLALAIATHASFVSPLGLLVATTALGVGNAFVGPAWWTLVPDLVPREDLPDAIALQSTSWNLARAVGPSVGGLLIARLGPAFAFALNAVSFAGVIAAIIRSPARPRAPDPEPMMKAILTGARFALGSRDLRVVSGTTAAFGFVASPVLALLPAMVARELRGTSASFGLALGAFGAGALMGAVALKALRRRVTIARTIPAVMVLSGAATLGLSFAGSLPLVGLAVAPAGAAWLMILSTENTLVQLVTPLTLRGRVKSIDALFFLGAYATGSTLAGLLANSSGVRPVLLGSAVCAMLVGAITTSLKWPELP